MPHQQIFRPPDLIEAAKSTTLVHPEPAKTAKTNTPSSPSHAFFTPPMTMSPTPPDAFSVPFTAAPFHYTPFQVEEVSLAIAGGDLPGFNEGGAGIVWAIQKLSYG